MYEASAMLFYKEVVYSIVALISFWIVFLLPITILSWLIPFFYWINIILILCVKFFGISKLGAQRWLEIPFINFTIQPSEIFKIFFILMLAYLIKKNPPNKFGYNLKDFIIFSFYILLPFYLILDQPDLGTALILLLVGYGILFIIGVNKKIWISMFLILAISSPLLYSSLHDYQKRRIADFISTKPSHQVKNSLIAIGSGGLIGNKKEEATQTHLKFLPIATSDFIFAYFGERFGFIGSFILILLYLFLIIHLLLYNIRYKEHYLLRVMATGVSLMLFLYLSVNIAMTVGLAPVVGIPIPLLSYGGSSFVTFCILFGIIQNLISFRFDTTYESVRMKKPVLKGISRDPRYN
ncbi:MAG: Rod shape-determining protein RodA [uncultured Campylobacterales bacterium]|uniref:Cell wall polymerase n=1 Tax=uncultured Campylobacterales bacterium TaxID=352960 RepID=A0A6S6S6H3_9BACT|nr:MAG: Rod shape-determining protein RodA [uncultured Campylobacterales bacterium]